MKKAVVIGANGQDGSLLSELLEKQKVDVIRIDQNMIDSKSPALKEVAFDICDPSHIEKLVQIEKPEEIYHLAAFHHSAQDHDDESPENLKKSIEVNELSLYFILSSVAKYSPSTRVFYAASSLIFGDPETELLDENSPINPNSFYGIAKASGMFLCRKFRKEHNVFASCGILFNHESSRRQGNFLFPKVINSIIETQQDSSTKLELGTLESVVDWGYAPDYVDAMQRILSHNCADDFVVATGIPHTVNDFVRIAYDTVGLNWRDHVCEKEGILRRVSKPLIGNSKKLKNATGWSPSVTFEEMVKKIVQEKTTKIKN